MAESDMIIISRAFVAAILGFIIGWQRESTGAAAGDRTFALMALGIASITGYVNVTLPNETARVIAGLLTGIGFMGGGMIMRMETGRIRGLTTAASLWTATSIGIMVTGHFVLGIAMTIGVLLILSWERLPLLSRFGIHSPRTHSTDSTSARDDSKKD